MNLISKNKGNITVFSKDGQEPMPVLSQDCEPVRFCFLNFAPTEKVTLKQAKTTHQHINTFSELLTEDFDGKAYRMDEVGGDYDIHYLFKGEILETVVVDELCDDGWMGQYQEASVLIKLEKETKNSPEFAVIFFYYTVDSLYHLDKHAPFNMPEPSHSIYLFNDFEHYLQGMDHLRDTGEQLESAIPTFDELEELECLEE